MSNVKMIQIGSSIVCQRLRELDRVGGGHPKKTWWDCVRGDKRVLACPMNTFKIGKNGDGESEKLADLGLPGKWPLKRCG